MATQLQFLAPTSKQDARYPLIKLVGSATLDVASLVDAAGATSTITATGVVLGDFVLVSFGVDLQGITVTAYVSAADTISVRVQNETGGTIDLASTTVRYVVFDKNVGT
jgi:Na+/citrate or Na+/malate symporter